MMRSSMLKRRPGRPAPARSASPLRPSRAGNKHPEFQPTPMPHHSLQSLPMHVA